MDTRELQARLLPTPFVSSFVGRARPGDPFDADPARRAAAWAHWAVTSMTQMTGLAERSYTALTLPGKFYDPKGIGPTVRPHLEIPAHVLSRPDSEFPDRLAQIGNGLMSAWWVVSEVTAVRRALFNAPRGSVAEVVDLLNERRVALADALGALVRTAAPRWAAVERLLVTAPDGLSGDATGDFDTAEIAQFFPLAADLQLRVVYDTRLREKNGQWASRRIGVWQVHGVCAGARFALGVITPRLTKNSLFGDQMFAADKEAPAALLVRGLLLRRLVSRHLGVAVPVSGYTVAEPEPAVKPLPGPRLRAVVAQVGQKLPEASVEAAVHFLQSYPDPDTAWEVLARWATHGRHLLTVSHDGFVAAHRSALRSLRRLEDPERDDINLVLPLAWDDKNRVVRVTFNRPKPDDPSA